MSGQKAAVSAVVKTRDGFKHSGSVIAEPNCWSMLKGGLSADASGPADIYFEVIHIRILEILSIVLNSLF